MNILKNISVRTVIILLMSFLTIYSFIPIVFNFNDFDKLSLYNKLPYIIFSLTLFFIFYLSKFLVNPILKIQKTLKEITDGNINTKINLFGNNCAGKLIPDISTIRKNTK